MKRMIWALLPLLLLGIAEQPAEKLIFCVGCNTDLGTGMGENRHDPNHFDPLASFFYSPGVSPDQTDGGDTLKYIFMGHGYDWQGGSAKVDPRLERLDYSPYHRIMLGGDMCSEAFARKSTLIYLDSVFDLDNPRTHYALGNHEARNESHEWFEEVTGHKTYATHSEFGLTVFTLNTTLNPGDCEELDAQFRMLKNICDTISVSSHLIIIQHHGVWKNVPGISTNQLTYSNWAYPYWDANCFEDSTLYYQSIYPMLVRVQQRGVQVISVLGDAGVREKGLVQMSTDSIYYISSGIDNSRYANDSLALDTVPKDKLLLFEHIPDEQKLWWRFVDLDSLAGQ